MPQQQSNLSTAEPNDNGSMFLISGLLEHTATDVIRTTHTIRFGSRHPFRVRCK